MFKLTRKNFAVPLFVGMLVTGTAFPAMAAKESLIGKVSTIDESAGTLMIAEDTIEIDANDASIRKKGVESATLADIAEGDTVKIDGSADSSTGVIQATKIKEPAKLKGYDVKITGTTKNVNTSAKTFAVFGQQIKASGLSGVSMSSKTISFGNMRSGVSVDVYATVKDNTLFAKKLVIRSESCNFCH